MVPVISVHDAHIVNTLCPIILEVMDKEVSLLFSGLCQRCVVPVGCACDLGWICHWPLHGATCKDEVVAAHVRGGESFSGEVLKPVPEIVMTCIDEAAPFTIKGMAD